MKLPDAKSHKGQNGKLLIIGGSSLFHSASLWAAELASHFVDMVHYASTEENAQIFINLKTKFTNGIVVGQKDIPHYTREDDVVLIGPGMMRRDKNTPDDEAKYTKEITRLVLTSSPDKKVVCDAGALHEIDTHLLKGRSAKVIVTPHQIEFAALFGTDLSSKSDDEKERIVQEAAKENDCVIIMKSTTDYVSDGTSSFRIEGGNAGLTKGGSGDVLSALIASLYTKNDALTSCVLGSYLIKTAADKLFDTVGYWYNIDDLIKAIPSVLVRERS